MFFWIANISRKGEKPVSKRWATPLVHDALERQRPFGR